MSGNHSSHPPAGSLAGRVFESTGTSPVDCYQCGRCAAGCMQNVQGEMDLSPTRLMRLLQLEVAFDGEPAQAKQYADRALSADAPWLCAGCLACTTRCPQGIDIAGMMDLLREEAMKRGVASKSRRARDIQKFHQVFLDGTTKRGRIHELAMVMMYKLKTGHFLADAMLGPAMLRKGKLHIKPEPAPSPQKAREAAEKLKRNGEAGQ